jgi:phage baseplate assembly protein W
LAEVGYGVDVYCWDRLRTGRLVSGVELVAQAIYRRLTTPRGTLRDGEDGQTYGLDLQDFIGQVGTANAVAAIPALVRAEVLKDDRITNVAVSATTTTDRAGLVAVTIQISAELVNPGDRFELTLSVSAVSVSVLGFTDTSA